MRRMRRSGFIGAPWQREASDRRRRGRGRGAASASEGWPTALKAFCESATQPRPARRGRQGDPMPKSSPSVHKKIEVVGTSEKSFADAAANAVARASKSVRGLEWFEVTELRG